MTNDYSSNSAAQSMRETLYPDKPVGAVGFPRREHPLLLTSWVYGPDYYAVGLRPRLGGCATISLVLSGSVLGLTLRLS